MPVTTKMLGIVALGMFASTVLGADDFPLVGTYTRKIKYAGLTAPTQVLRG
jgi:hypothetical protein